MTVPLSCSSAFIFSPTFFVACSSMGIYILDTVLDFLFVVSKCFRIVGILVLVVPVLSFLLLIWRAQSITRVGLRACFCFCERLVAQGPLHRSGGKCCIYTSV